MKMYYEVMETLVALVMIILYMLYTVACVKIQLLWSLFTYQSDDLLTAV